MKEFKTLGEFQEYRKVCPICHRQLFIKGCAPVGDHYLMKASYKFDHYIFNIGIKNPRIGYSITSIPSANLTIIGSINPLKLTSMCSRRAKDDGLHTANEYNIEFGIFNDGKPQGVVNKVAILNENFLFFSNERFYSVKLSHTVSKCIVEERDLFFKVKKTFNLNYNFINQDRLYNKDYILNKIETITLLQ